MKKSVVLFPLIAALLLCSCENGKGSSGASLDALKTENSFVYGEGFFLPPVNDVYEYTCSFTAASENDLREIVDIYFGEGEYARGVKIDLPDESGEFLPIMEWDNFAEEKQAQLGKNGSFLVSDSSFYEAHGEGDWNSPSGIVFAPEFDRQMISFPSGDISVREAEAQAYQALLPIVRSISPELDVRAVYAKKFKWHSDDTEYAEIFFSTVADGQPTRCVLCDELDDIPAKNIMPDDPYGICPFYIVSLFDDGKIQMAACTVWNGLIKDIKKGRRLEIKGLDDMLELLDKKAGSYAGHMTLEYAELEYTPTSRDGGQEVLSPFWAVYYRDDEDNCGVMYVNAQTGEIFKAPVYAD